MALALAEKIAAPILWDDQPKFRIQELRENQYQDVMNLIKHHYFSEEPMCRSSELLQDRTSFETYLSQIRLWIKDTTSLVAMSQKTGRVVGAAITRVNSICERSNTYSRVQIYEGETYETIKLLLNALVIQANVYEFYGHETYLRVYVLIVHPSYKTKGVGSALLEACYGLALSMQIPVVGGIFTSSENQSNATSAGFSMLTEIPYNNWMVDEEIVFEDPGIGNYSAAFMAALTPDEDSLKLRKKFNKKDENSNKK